MGALNLPRELGVGEAVRGGIKAVARGSPRPASFSPCGAQGHLAGWRHSLRAAPEEAT